MAELLTGLLPLPTPVDHTEIKHLKDYGVKCPYCGGTTGFHSIFKVICCYSCDAVWNYRRQFIGTVTGIGLA